MKTITSRKRVVRDENTVIVFKKCRPRFLRFFAAVVTVSMLLAASNAKAQVLTPEESLYTSALLFYNAGSGLGATALLDNRGNYTFVSEIPGFAPGWTHITGTASGGVIFYNASTGEGAIALIDVSGNYKFVGSISGFAKGWTHIAGL